MLIALFLVLELLLLLLVEVVLIFVVHGGGHLLTLAEVERIAKLHVNAGIQTGIADIAHTTVHAMKQLGSIVHILDVGSIVEHTLAVDGY